MPMSEMLGIRLFSGLGVFSCIECDRHEQRDKPLPHLGQTSDLASHALLVARWRHNLTMFTNPLGRVTAAREAVLAQLILTAWDGRGARCDRRRGHRTRGGFGGATGRWLLR